VFTIVGWLDAHFFQGFVQVANPVKKRCVFPHERPRFCGYVLVLAFLEASYRHGTDSQESRLAPCRMTPGIPHPAG